MWKTGKRAEGREGKGGGPELAPMVQEGADVPGGETSSPVCRAASADSGAGQDAK